MLRTGLFDRLDTWSTSWERLLEWPLYERWLRSKSYAQAIRDLDGFLDAERTSLQRAFPDGQIVEPFVTTLWVLQRAEVASGHGDAAHP